MMNGHSIEFGHDCPRCGKNSRCLIEDGRCENGGNCDDCIKELYMDEESRDYYGEPDDWDGWEEDLDSLKDWDCADMPTGERVYNSDAYPFEMAEPYVRIVEP